LGKGWLKKKLHLALVSGRDLRACRRPPGHSYDEARHLADLNIDAPIAVIAHESSSRGAPPFGATRGSSPLPVLMGTRRLLFLGRIDRQRNHAPCREAWGRLARDFPDWRLVIAGPIGPAIRADPEESLAIRGVLDKTTFVGSVRRQRQAAPPLRLRPLRPALLPGELRHHHREALRPGMPVITTKGTPWQVLACAAPAGGLIWRRRA